MWEVALRILLGAVARAAGRRDRWIEPVLGHCTQHYVRVYVRIRDGAGESNRQSEAYAYAWIGARQERGWSDRPPATGKFAGPLWAGPFVDGPLVRRILDDVPAWAGKDVVRRLELLGDESGAPPLYYTIDEFTRHLKTNAPKMERLVGRLRDAGHAAMRTHFHPRAFKTDATPDQVRDALR
jgi:tRNA (guanine26-N2/guanine27-N2)-dimethyltransferase